MAAMKGFLVTPLVAACLLAPTLGAAAITSPSTRALGCVIKWDDEAQR